MQAPRWRKVAATAAIGLAALASLASTGEENTATKVDEEGTETSADTASEPSSFAVGDAVALGDWQVVVHGVTDPVEPSDSLFSPDEGNRWVAVDVEVANNSDSAATVSSLMCFELQDGENRSYDMTLTGGDASASTPDGEVDPGGARRGSITYEVPADATGLQLRFKCDLFSSGSAVIALA